MLLLGGGALATQALTQLVPAGTLHARAGLPAAVAVMALLNFAFFGAEAFLPLALSKLRAQARDVRRPVAHRGRPELDCWEPGCRSVSQGASVDERSLRADLSSSPSASWQPPRCSQPRVPVATAIVAWAVAGLGMGLAFTTTSAAILEGRSSGRGRHHRFLPTTCSGARRSPGHGGGRCDHRCPVCG